MPNLVVHGLGYVGLTAAVHFAKAGWDVIGYDPDESVVEALNMGQPKAGEFLGYLAEDVSVLSGRLRATASRDTLLLPTAVHLVAVPTERAGRPDDTILSNVLMWLDVHVADQGLVLIESTVSPDLHLPVGAGKRYHLAICPRRDWFADPSKNLETLPRVVGGVTPACTEKAVEVLSSVSKDILRTDWKTATITKNLENALLHLQIAFVQQLAAAFPDVNIAEAVKLAGTHWRLTPLYLSAGSGGRCVPVGMETLTLASRMSLAEQALVENIKHRGRIAFLSKGKTVVLGVAYRPDFKDAGNSPGLAIAKSIRADVADPMYTHEELRGMGATPAPYLDGYDTVILATPHTVWQNLPDRLPWVRGQRVIDPQGTWKAYRELFNEYGVDYRVVGEAGWLTSS